MQKKNKTELTLTKKDFSFVCPLKTEDMIAVDSGYFCDKCKKIVHDVSDMTQSEYKTLVEKTDDICVTFKKVATVSLVFSLAACTTAPKVNPPLLGKIVPKNSCTTKQEKPKDADVLAPYKVVDKKREIEIKYQKEVEIAGGISYVEPPKKSN